MLRKIVPTLFLCFLVFFLMGQQKKTSVRKKVVPKPVTSIKVGNLSASRLARLEQRKMASQSLVVLRNEHQLLPLARLDTLRILLVALGNLDGSTLSKLAERYAVVDLLSIRRGEKPIDMQQGLSKSPFFNLVIFAIGPDIQMGKPQSGTNNLVDELSSDLSVPTIQQQVDAIIGKMPSRIGALFLFFGGKNSESQWIRDESCDALVVTDSADRDRMDLAMQVIFGAISSKGKLSFAFSNYPKGAGVEVASIDRLSYILPEEIGIDSLRLAQKMDSLVRIGLNAKAFPGCQLLLAKNGKVFFQKSYGYHTYQSDLPVLDDDQYDLASVTKVLAPVPALMMLSDQNKFLVTKRMSDYWPNWKGSNKESILVADLLSHQARLRSGVVLWPSTLDGLGHYKPGYYSSQPLPGFKLRVADGLYVVDSYPDTVYKAIRESPLLKVKKYAYSDLGFVILPKVIEQLSGEKYEDFLRNRLYGKLGAASLKFHPATTEPKTRIIPTEFDQDFRHELLQGFVHDETAALLGGVSGNAGLFGCMGDVAKVMQLYLQNGKYGNERYISEETLKTWTSSHTQKSNNRRGYGFDKPGLQARKGSSRERYPSASPSEKSYGHSGFTGTFVWADPVDQLLFVFLSNRVYPDRDNHKINKLRIRPLLLEAFFKLAK